MDSTTVVLIAILVAIAGVGAYLVLKPAAPPPIMAAPIGPDVGWQAAGLIAGTAATVAVGLLSAIF